MLLPSWSLGLVGLGLFAAPQGSPSSGTGGSRAPTVSVQTEPRLVELSSGTRLVLVSPDDSGQSAACVGLVVGIATNDRLRRAAALVELELRRENLTKAYRERFGAEPGGSRMLDVLGGDVASLCVSVSKSDWESAISIVLQALRPVVVTPQKFADLRERWRNHEGLGAVLIEDPLQGQLQELAWLGFPEAAASIPRALEQTMFLNGPNLIQTTPGKPSRVVLTIAGDYSPQFAEKFVRTHAIIRDQSRGPKSHVSWLTEIATRPSHQFRRFSRVRSPARRAPAGFFSWPISQLDVPHAHGLKVLANLLERRLNRTGGPDSTAVANCRLIVGRGFGTFVIELKPTSATEIDAMEKSVLSAIDQLRTSTLDASELQSASENETGSGIGSAQSGLERAWTATQRTYYFGGRAQPTVTNDVNLRRLIEHDLPPENLAEMYIEAAPPRQTSAPSRNAKNQSAGSQKARFRNQPSAGHARGGQPPMNRRGGRIYTVQKGESLQMIAHKHHTTIAEIIHANGIQHPDQIQPGTAIVIPVSSSSAAPSK